MPIVRKLTPEEVEALESKQNKGDSARAEIARQYDQFLIEFGPGEHGEVQLDEGENKMNIRNRLKGAAERRGVKLEFLRANGLVVRFKVVGEDGTEVFAQPPVEERLEAIAA